MTVEINLNDAEAALISKYAAKKQVSVSEFIHETAAKSVRNAEYLAMLERGFKQLEEGGGTKMTFAELEKIING